MDEPRIQIGNLLEYPEETLNQFQCFLRRHCCCRGFECNFVVILRKTFCVKHRATYKYFDVPDVDNMTDAKENIITKYISGWVVVSSVYMMIGLRRLKSYNCPCILRKYLYL